MRNSMTRSRAWWRGLTARPLRRGAITAETAIVLVVWVTLLMGVFDLGMAVLRNNTLSHLARQGARRAIVHGSRANPQLSVWGPARFVGNLGDSSEISRAMSPYTNGVSPGEIVVTVEWIDGGNAAHDRVRVSVTTQYHPMLGILTGNQPIPLSASSTMSITH